HVRRAHTRPGDTRDARFGHSFGCSEAVVPQGSPLLENQAGLVEPDTDPERPGGESGPPTAPVAGTGHRSGCGHPGFGQGSAATGRPPETGGVGLEWRGPRGSSTVIR